MITNKWELPCLFYKCLRGSVVEIESCKKGIDGLEGVSREVLGAKHDRRLIATKGIRNVNKLFSDL